MSPPLGARQEQTWIKELELSEKHPMVWSVLSFEFSIYGIVCASFRVENNKKCSVFGFLPVSAHPVKDPCFCAGMFNLAVFNTLHDRISRCLQGVCVCVSTPASKEFQMTMPNEASLSMGCRDWQSWRTCQLLTQGSIQSSAIQTPLFQHLQIC